MPWILRWPAIIRHDIDSQPCVNSRDNSKRSALKINHNKGLLLGTHDDDIGFDEYDNDDGDDIDDDDDDDDDDDTDDDDDDDDDDDEDNIHNKLEP